MVAPADICENVPADYRRSGDAYYKTHGQQATWYAARGKCWSEGAQMANLLTADRARAAMEYAGHLSGKTVAIFATKNGDACDGDAETCAGNLLAHKSETLDAAGEEDVALPDEAVQAMQGSMAFDVNNGKNCASIKSSEGSMKLQTRECGQIYDAVICQFSCEQRGETRSTRK